MEYTVYWIHRPSHTDRFTEGYIGVTKRDVKVRFQEHKSQKNNIVLCRAFTKYDDIEVTVLFCGIDEELALLLESEYRPLRQCGWNIAAGGGLPPLFAELSDKEATRKKMSIASTGRLQSEELRKRRSIIMTGKKWSEEAKAAASLRRKGTKLSEATKKKMSQARTGTKRSEQYKLKVSGANSVQAKVANIYNSDTNELIAENVCISEFCKEFGYSQGHLSSTARADRREKSTSVNRCNHKGIYAVYVD